MSKAFDTNNDVSGKLPQLKALGITHIIRYIATGSKSVTPSEARAIADSGILLATVYEAWGDTKREISGGLGGVHASEFMRKAPLIGQPEGSAMYFAIDNDESAGDIRNRIVPYFRAVKETLGTRYRVGVYGSGDVCAAVLDAGAAELAWLSNATGWSGFRAFLASGRWCLRQHVPQNLLGLDTDPDDINPERPDIGAFIPFGRGEVFPAPGPAPGTPHDAFWLQQQLSAAGFYAGDIDGKIGPKSITAMIRFVERTQQEHGT